MIGNQSLDTFNVAANIATFVGGALGGAVVIYMLFQVRRLVKLVADVLAPKAGIENHLTMCAQVVECDPDGTCIVNDEGMIVLVNKSMEDISGYHRSQLVGQSVEILVPDAVKGMHPQHREGFITGPTSRPMRGLKLKHKRGTEIAVGINLNHYRDSSGGYTIAKVRIPDSEWRKSGELARMSE